MRVGEAGVCSTGVIEMNGIRIAAIALIVAGVLGLVYGGFSYTKETHEAKVGPLELSISEKQTINVPIWAGVGAIVVGGVLLVLGSKGR
jgi:hypothetical protein